MGWVLMCAICSGHRWWVIEMWTWVVTWRLHADVGGDMAVNGWMWVVTCHITVGYGWWVHNGSAMGGCGWWVMGGGRLHGWHVESLRWVVVQKFVRM